MKQEQNICPTCEYYEIDPSNVEASKEDMCPSCYEDYLAQEQEREQEENEIYFTRARVSRDDLESIGYDTGGISDERMEYLASKIKKYTYVSRGTEERRDEDNVCTTTHWNKHCTGCDICKRSIEQD